MGGHCPSGGGPLRFGLVVTSDTVARGLADDRVGPLVGERLAREGHTLVYYRVVPNDPVEIRGAVLDAVAMADIVLVTGGSGPGPRDRSVDTLRLIASRELPGLGWEHRWRSKDEVGLRALLSRTTAFVVGESLVMVSPGSPNAVGVALDILLEVGYHAVQAIRGASGWGTLKKHKRGHHR